MKMKKQLIFAMVLIVGILLLSFVSASASRSISQYISPGLSSGFFGQAYAPIDRSMCEAGQDFIVQIAPGGCTPPVIRQDLLEERDVPITCQLAATKINPLIDVEAIDYISFGTKFPRGVKAMNFYPAQAALGEMRTRLNSPILNNIGYVVIVLERQQNASKLPNCGLDPITKTEVCWVEGNLTANIRYDIKNAFGIGPVNFYLPEMSDSDWEDQHTQYSFWNGKGYLRAEAIQEDRATISLYDGVREIDSVRLEEGHTSEKIYLPGFDCLTALELELKGLENPGTRARLDINGEVVEVGDGERFLENRCKVTDLEVLGLVQTVEGYCERDNGKKEDFVFPISPKIKLKIGSGEPKEYSVGDWLYSSGETAVYLGYAGTRGDTSREEDLYVYLFSIPEHEKEGLGHDKLKVISDVVYNIEYKDVTGNALTNFVANMGKFYMGVTQQFMAYVTKGDNYARIGYGQDEKIGGQDVLVVGLAGAEDRSFNEQNLDFREYYTKAMQDYDTVINSFGTEEYSEEEIGFAEKALFEKIAFASSTQQKRVMLDFCDEFNELYPDSRYAEKIKSYCDNALKLASPEEPSEDFLINGRMKTISFEGIYEPDEEEYSADIRIQGPNGQSRVFTFRHNEQIYLDLFRDNGTQHTGEFIQLIDLDLDSAEVQTSFVSNKNTAGKISDFFFASSKKTLEKGVVQSIGSDYVLTLEKVRLKKQAFVRVRPAIDDAGTEADFRFKIGIETRLIKLSPEKTKEKIEKIEKRLEKWEKISSTLNKVVKTLNTACYATQLALTLKNLVTEGILKSGKSIARQEVMRLEEGWNDECGNLTGPDKQYKTNSACLLGEAKKINGDVDERFDAMKSTEEYFKTMQDDPEIKIKDSLFGDTVYDSEKLKKKLLDNKYEEQLTDEINFDSVEIKGEQILVSDILKGLNSSSTSIEQMRDMRMNADLLDSDSDVLRRMSKAQLEKDLVEIYQNTNKEIEYKSVLNDLRGKEGLSNIDIAVARSGDVEEIIYEGGIKGTGGFGDMPDGSQIMGLQFGGTWYIVELQTIKVNEYSVLNVYSSQTGKKEGDSEDLAKEMNKKFAFRSYDSSAYENPYLSSSGKTYPVVRYFETEPYKGYPAIVPFDLKKGWYARLTQTMPVFGNLAPVDASGRPTSFSVCNVWEDGKENNGRPDDKCTLINTNTGQPYDQVSGLSKTEAEKLVHDASEAIKQARSQYPAKGRIEINIGGRDKFYVKVGEPAVDVPDLQCEEVMSPKECNVLFNVCDPVICPSSRCNLGGNYHVQDVIQSGIVGSVALCFPNWVVLGGDVYVPVCLSGINAGVKAWITVEKSHRDCLQDSLATGEMTGICDQVYSIHTCEFFWKHGIPLANLLIPKALELATGQKAKGGGEYMGISHAWENAGKSFDYFTQYYAKNSFKAFKERSTEEVGGEFCKVAVSGVYPFMGGDAFDALTDPNTPYISYARFEEIPHTTATVPAMSQYKVFYHIYAGENSRAYYKVYLKGGAETSFYEDLGMVVVAEGYIDKGDYATGSRDILGISGYKQLCTMVNGDEKCGFKQVSTDFAVNYVTELYMKEQTSKTDIKSAKECYAGTPSAYSLANPLNLAGFGGQTVENVNEITNPAIYDRGVIRICSSGNPGKGDDIFWNDPNQSRWKPVGVCDETMDCWLDTESVERVIKATDLKEDVLKNQNENYQQILENSGNYLSETEFQEKISEIKKQEDPSNQLSMITQIFDNVFKNNDKAYLYYLRGVAYAALALQKYVVSVPEKILGKDNATTDYLEEVKVIGERNPKYPLFEFQDGRTKENFYFQYSGSEWWWSRVRDHEESWFPVTLVEDPGFTAFLDERGIKLPPNHDREQIAKLQGKDYVGGLKELIARTIRNDEPKGVIDYVNVVGIGGGATLDTETVKMSSTKMFYLEQEEMQTPTGKYKEVLIDIVDSRWAWSFDMENWDWSSPTDTNKVSSDIILLFEILERDNPVFLDGANLIFSIDAETPVMGEVEVIGNGQDITGDKIWEKASKMVTDKHNSQRGEYFDNVCARFVTEVLTAARIGGFEAPSDEDFCPLDSVNTLVNELEKRDDFIEIQDPTSFEKGDVVAFKWSVGGQHMTIFNQYDSSNIKHLYVFGEGGEDDPAILQDYVLGPEASILGAYRYVG